MDTSNPGDVYADDPEELHLLRVEPRFDKVNTRAKPLVVWLSLFESDVATSFQLSHQSVDVLFRHVVNLFAETFVDGRQILEVFIFVMESAVDESHFTFNVADKLVVIDGIERVPLCFVGTVGHHRVKLINIILRQMLPLF